MYYQNAVANGNPCTFFSPNVSADHFRTSHGRGLRTPTGAETAEARGDAAGGWEVRRTPQKPVKSSSAPARHARVGLIAGSPLALLPQTWLLLLHISCFIRWAPTRSVICWQRWWSRPLPQEPCRNTVMLCLTKSKGGGEHQDWKMTFKEIEKGYNKTWIQ